MLETNVTKCDLDMLINKLENEISLLLQKQNKEMKQITELYGCMYNNILPMRLNKIKSHVYDE